MSASKSNEPTKTISKPDPRKAVDLPPRGPRNPDPLTDQPGSHPIETGIGAALGGAATGMAIGVAAGPAGVVTGTVAGAIAGALAGGLAGKGVGELIDPTTDENWIRDLLKNKPADTTDEWETQAREAYRFGWRSEAEYPHQAFDQVEEELRASWEETHPTRPWADSRSNVRDGYEQGRAVNGTKV